MPKLEKNQFSVQLSLTSVGEGNNRFNAVIQFSVSDAGHPFHNATLSYPGSSKEAVDMLKGMLEKAAGKKLPATFTSLSESNFIKLEKDLIGVLDKLNDLAKHMIGKTSEEKIEMIKNKK